MGTDGEIKYSSIVKVNAADVKQGLAVVSNPVENGIINLQFKNQVKGRYSIKIMSSEGQTVMINTVSYTGGCSNELLTLPRSLASGVYSLQIIMPDNSKATQMVIINNR